MRSTVRHVVILLAAVVLGSGSALAQTSAPATSAAPAAPAQGQGRQGRGGRGFNGPPPTTQALAKLAEQGATNARVHDPSTIVEDHGTYYVFFTGRDIGSWQSKDLLHWTAGPKVFNGGVAWTAAAVPGNRPGDFWAPDVVKTKDGFLIYYAVSVFGKRTSAIGVAKNKTLDPASPDYKWQDLGEVIHTTDADNFNAIDPAVFTDTDGSMWLSFGSFWNGIELIQLDPATGKRLKPDSPMTNLAKNRQCEASYIYPHAGKYYLFVNFGACCRGVQSTYNIRVGRADKITGPYMDADGKNMMDGGGTLVAESSGDFIGPGHAGIITVNGQEWMSMHFYDGSRGGTSELAIRKVVWSKEGWPTLGEGIGH